MIDLLTKFVIIIAHCVPSCRHGKCTPNNICVCDSGWTGDRCRTGNQ